VEETVKQLITIYYNCYDEEAQFVWNHLAGAFNPANLIRESQESFLEEVNMMRTEG